MCCGVPTGGGADALLKEVIAIQRRQVAAGLVEEITSFRDRGAKNVLVALPMLGDELVGVGNRDRAVPCLRIMVEFDVDDLLRCRMALDELEGVGRRRSAWGSRACRTERIGLFDLQVSHNCRSAPGIGTADF